MTPTARPGSTIDRAVRALQSSGPLPRAELARLIERDDDELDGLLRFGVRMGLLRRDDGTEGPTYALGDGVPVELEARPAAPAPNEYTARRESQHVLKAEAARHDATDRDTPAIISPVGGPMGAGQAAAAAPRPGAALPPAVLEQIYRSPQEIGTRPGVLDRQLQPYRPVPGSQAEMLLAHLQRHAPHGGEVWLSPAELAASGARQYAVSGSLQTAVLAGAVIARGTPRQFQTGPNAAAVLGVVPVLAPPPAPPAAAPRPTAAAPAPDRAMAAAADAAAFMLAQLEGEIDRLSRTLQVVRRRRDEFAAAVKGARLAPPQSGHGTTAASVRGLTESA